MFFLKFESIIIYEFKYIKFNYLNFFFLMDNKIIKEPNIEDKILLNQFYTSLYKLLLREYYSKTINPFFCLKLLIQLVHSKITDKLKYKCAVLLFSILEKLSVNEKMQENIIPIINDMLDNVLTRKADYPIIIDYAVLLVRTKNFSKAIMNLQTFSNENRFMNCGEIIFYKSLIEYFIEGKMEVNLFIKSICRAIPLIKNNSYIFYDFLLDFLSQKMLLKELKEIINKNEYINIYLKNNKDKFNYYKVLISSLDDIVEDDSEKKNIINFALSLDEHFSNFGLIEKFKEMVEIYYLENSSDNNNIIEIEVEKKIFLIEKFKLIDEKLIIDYLKFLVTYFQFNPFDLKVFLFIIELFDEFDIIIYSEKKKLFVKEKYFESFKYLMISFYKNLLYSILKKKIKNIVQNSIRKGECIEYEKIERILIVLNKTKKIITGDIFLEINQELKKNIFKIEFINFINKIKI